MAPGAARVANLHQKGKLPKLNSTGEELIPLVEISSSRGKLIVLFEDRVFFQGNEMGSLG
jgi:hypothetical protein